MAELTRYTDRMIRDSTPMPWDFYRADEVDPIIAEREQLHRDLDAAYAALREIPEDADINTAMWYDYYTRHADMIKKAKEAVDGQAQPG
jgi:hypothetical protein